MNAAIALTESKAAPPRSSTLPHAKDETEPIRGARGADLPADQTRSESQCTGVGGRLSSDQARFDLHRSGVATELLFHAAFLDDIENVRKATANRLGAMEREGVGGVQYESQLEALERIEHQAILELQRAMRRHPLGPWVKRTVGVGEKQAARLIAAIGDVCWNHAEDRPRRGPAELWAYCGYRPDQKRRKGVQSNWNADAKMRAFLIAESCIKQTGSGGATDAAEPSRDARRPSPYRVVYDAARLSWAERDTTDLHRHNHALRCVAKAVLRDMFLEAKRLHALGHPQHDTQSSSAEGAVLAPDQTISASQSVCVGGIT